MVKRYIVGSFLEEAAIMHAVRALREEGIKIYDTYTPYAVHGLDEAMGIRRTRLPWVTFIAGTVGCLLALFFQYWTSTVDWPLNVGGKPPNSWPAFIPVTFEITILVAGLATVAAFLVLGRLWWGKKVRLPITDVTDDVFALALDNRDGSLDIREIQKRLAGLGAVKVEEKVVVS